MLSDMLSQLKYSHPNGPFWACPPKRTPSNPSDLVQGPRWLSSPLDTARASASTSRLPHLTRPRPGRPFASPALPQQSLETLLPTHTYTKEEVSPSWGGHHVDSHPVSRHCTLLLVVFKVQVTGRCSKWIWKYVFPIIKFWELHFYSVAQPLQCKGPSSRLMPANMHLFPMVNP